MIFWAPKPWPILFRHLLFFDEICLFIINSVFTVFIPLLDKQISSLQKWFKNYRFRSNFCSMLVKKILNFARDEFFFTFLLSGAKFRSLKISLMICYFLHRHLPWQFFQLKFNLLGSHSGLQAKSKIYLYGPICALHYWTKGKSTTSSWSIVSGYKDGKLLPWNRYHPLFWTIENPSFCRISNPRSTCKGHLAEKQMFVG